MLGQWLGASPGSVDCCKCYHIPSEGQDIFYDSDFCEINTQVIFSDKLTILSQAKSLHTYSPRMKVFPKSTFSSSKEVKVDVGDIGYIA